MAFTFGGLIYTYAFYIYHADLLHSLLYPIIEYAPYTRRGLFESISHTAYRHLLFYKQHRIGLEKHRETTVCTGPWNIDKLYFMVTDPEARNTGDSIGVEKNSDDAKSS